MSNKITGKMISEFEYNTDTGEMVCKNMIQHDSDFLPIEVVMRVYVSLGGHVDRAHRNVRYGIRNVEDNKRVVERIHNEFQEDEKI